MFPGLSTFGKFEIISFVRFPTQVKRQKAATNTISSENNQTSFSLPNRTTGLVNPSAGHGRRLSLVQELTQSINPESLFNNGDINMNILNSNDPESNARAKPWRRPGRISTTVINEEDEEGEESRDEELPVDPGTEEANVGFYRNQNKQEQQQSVDVVELRNQLTDDISELKTKLSRVENQLAVLIHLMQNQKNKPELAPRHSQSFPTPMTSRSSPSSSSQDSRKDHSASAVNNSDAKDSENAESPSWLSPTPVRSKRSISDPSYRKQSGKSPRDRNNETESPVVNLARHGRRKISDA